MNRSQSGVGCARKTMGPGNEGEDIFHLFLVSYKNILTES